MVRGTSSHTFPPSLPVSLIGEESQDLPFALLRISMRMSPLLGNSFFCGDVLEGGFTLCSSFFVSGVATAIMRVLSFFFDALGAPISWRLMWGALALFPLVGAGAASASFSVWVNNPLFETVKPAFYGLCVSSDFVDDIECIKPCCDLLVDTLFYRKSPLLFEYALQLLDQVKPLSNGLLCIFLTDSHLTPPVHAEPRMRESGLNTLGGDVVS